MASNVLELKLSKTWLKLPKNFQGSVTPSELPKPDVISYGYVGGSLNPNLPRYLPKCIAVFSNRTTCHKGTFEQHSMAKWGEVKSGLVSRDKLLR